MPSDRTEAVNLWPYVGIYILTQVILYLAWLGFGFLVPAPNSVNSAASFVIIFASTFFAYSVFIRRNGRLFNRGEYWRMVLFSTAAALMFSAVCLLVSITIGIAPDVAGIPALAWIIVFVVLAAFGFCLNAVGFSKWFGKVMLKTFSARQIQLDTEPFK
ncbi:ABZJ_00895 family protein [Mesorhizobium neociceri]|uniref:Uncharacterized protein n=1 Tax=Mesorhizobium neociceri TaxID=1307853 RepID=A0A838BEK1_9HYPH|nr:ABZJ_00895 family protein [Mesorhizobium neociceri]MBA1144331.1 hypothetical protein [Mesorhizobium neociceri]